MKHLFYSLTALAAAFALILLFFAYGMTTGGISVKQLTGKWCHPTIEMRGLPIEALSADEKRMYQFVLGGLEKIFAEMCIEYYDDRETGCDSFQASIQLSESDEKQNSFGEYELLASGKRLVLHTNDGQSINIELTKLTKTEHQWRLQYRDLVRLGGSNLDLPADLPQLVTYVTFKKGNRL